MHAEFRMPRAFASSLVPGRRAPALPNAFQLGLAPAATALAHRLADGRELTQRSPEPLSIETSPDWLWRALPESAHCPANCQPLAIASLSHLSNRLAELPEAALPTQ